MIINLFYYKKILDNKTILQHRNTDFEHSIMDLLLCSLAKKFKGTTKSSYSSIINKLIKNKFINKILKHI